MIVYACIGFEIKIHALKSHQRVLNSLNRVLTGSVKGKGSFEKRVIIIL